MNRKLSSQIKAKIKSDKKSKKEPGIWEVYSGNTSTMVSTGSTLLDLAISGGVTKEGGLPGGIMVEIAGESSSGKTVLLCEIGGYIQRMGGDAIYNDPEGRLNKQFAQMFGISIEALTMEHPDTVTQMFQKLYSWSPKTDGPIHGILTDSLAALSTNMEMDNEDGDKMGGRRAKEFSEGFRKFARVLMNKNYLMVCSNQLRETMATWGEKYTAPGGKAIGFYSSVRMRIRLIEKLTDKKTIHGKEVKHVYGIKSEVEITKSSVDAPYRKAVIYIVFDYGVDDIRANLQYLKDFSSESVYHIKGRKLDKSLDKSISIIEEEGLEKKLKEEVIQLWREIQEKFKKERKPKKR